MSYTATRRSNGCWTCKLRRKKCDEGQPTCENCNERSITCHGYDFDFPPWMDNGARQKAELASIQRGVRENKHRIAEENRRRQRQQAEADARRSNLPSLNGQPGLGNSALAGADMLVNSYDSTSHAEPGLDMNEMEDDYRPHVSFSHDISPAECATKPPTPIIDMSRVSLTTPETGNTPPVTVPSHFRFSGHREPELLMHYLDVVFALQFRFHVAPVDAGGRGWLLWLLMETKPLYHAALSLGALHQHSLLSPTERHDTLLELNEHHNLALKELQIFLKNEYDASGAVDRGRKRNLQILACGVEFISFELFRGGINVWDAHLKTLATWLSQTYESQEWKRTNVSSQVPVSIGSPHASHGIEDTAEKFLTGAILWFDILACASTGKAPLMRNSHDSLLRSGHIYLANIVGCQAWVALLMSEIAQIQEEHRRNTLDQWELVKRGNPIRIRLAHGISALRREIDEAFSNLGQVPIVLNASAHSEAIHRAVTLAFAYATQVYLNTTATGAYPYNPEVRNGVRDTVYALQEMRKITDLQASRSLVWPICIAGSMAEDPAQQNFFRGLIVDLGEQAHDFGNSVTVLHIMERCWQHWQNRTQGGEMKGYTWLSAMEEIDQRVLLV